jgi:predicted acyl esterase
MKDKPPVALRYPNAIVRSPVPPPGTVFDENVYVAMRDGIQLAADIYRPQRPGRYPALLSLSPYSKDIQQKPPQWSHAIESGATSFYVAHGYAHVIAQGRGAGYSQGQWRWFDEKEQTDGYDLIEWIAQQPWCDGNIGMIGDSYWSWSQWAAAITNPPHLKCICLCDATTDFYRDACYQGGIFNAQFMPNWIAYHTAMAAWPGPVEGKLPPMNLNYEIATHPYCDSFYEERSPRSRIEQIKCPVLSIAPQGGLMHFRGQLDGYTRIKAPKKLMVVPPTGFWSHLRYLTNPALNRQMLRWFDFWLKGLNTGITNEPEIAIFDAGTRRWRYENEYPLARTQWTKLFLRATASSPATEPPYGSLDKEPPNEEEPDRLRMPDSYAALIAGKPVVAYATPALEKDLQVWGPLSLTLYASSSEVDTAWFIYVSDIHPDGRVVQLSRGMLRASFRAVDEQQSRPGQPFHPFTYQELLTPGIVYEFKIELRPIFYTFRTGHKLRVQIASEDIQYNNPLRNIDVQLLPWPVENAVHHDGAHQSHLVLPVIPEVPEIQPVPRHLLDIDWPLVPGSWMPNTDGHPLRPTSSD